MDGGRPAGDDNLPENQNQPDNIEDDSDDEAPQGGAERKNLFHYFQRADRTREASPSVAEEAGAAETDSGEGNEEEDDDAPPPAKRLRQLHHHNVARYAVQRELAGQLHPWACSRAHHSLAALHHEACLVDGHPWRTPLLGSPHPLHPSGHLQNAQFDSTGELLATVGGSVLLVHSGESLQQALRSGASAVEPGSAAVKVSPLLAIRTPLSKLHAVRWNPANENVLAVASSSSRSVLIYDLQRTQGRPLQTITLPTQSSGGVGAGDAGFFSPGSGNSGGNAVTNGGSGGGGTGGGYTVLVGGAAGQVYLWDSRQGGPPASTLHSTHGGLAHSVFLADDGRAVIAGTQGGDVKIWDVRAGSGTALRFGGVVQHHSMLASVNLRSALAEVPGLIAQAGEVPRGGMQSMARDPCNPGRVGFHLGCGWSGALDLTSLTVTHVHAPPQALADEQPTAEDGAAALVMWTQMAAPGERRVACWSADGRRFLVPSRRQDALSMLDFSEGRFAGCGVWGAEMEDDGDRIRIEGVEKDENEREGEGGKQARAAPLPPSAAEIPLSQAAICVAAAPDGSGTIVAGGAHSCMSLVRPG